jgi:hypothetical protein
VTTCETDRPDEEPEPATRSELRRAATPHVHSAVTLILLPLRILGVVLSVAFLPRSAPGVRGALTVAAWVATGARGWLAPCAIPGTCAPAGGACARVRRGAIENEALGDGAGRRGPDGRDTGR